MAAYRGDTVAALYLPPAYVVTDVHSTSASAPASASASASACVSALRPHSRTARVAVPVGLRLHLCGNTGSGGRTDSRHFCISVFPRSGVLHLRTRDWFS